MQFTPLQTSFIIRVCNTCAGLSVSSIVPGTRYISDKGIFLEIQHPKDETSRLGFIESVHKR